MALIDERKVIERILCHLGLWEPDVRVRSARDPPKSVSVETIIESWFADPFPDYEHEPVKMYASE